MQIYWNKRNFLHKKKVHLPQDWYGIPTRPQFHCFGTPIWPSWRHVKTLHSFQLSLAMFNSFWILSPAASLLRNALDPVVDEVPKNSASAWVILIWIIKQFLLCNKIIAYLYTWQWELIQMSFIQIQKDCNIIIKLFGKTKLPKSPLSQSSFEAELRKFKLADLTFFLYFWGAIPGFPSLN